MRQKGSTRQFPMMTMNDGWYWVIVQGNDAGDWMEDHYIEDGKSLCGELPTDEYPLWRSLVDAELKCNDHYCRECERLAKELGHQE
ncbi:hypothetical protein LCGC14_0275550 [marine sediment metagenome]|uniref:Uncharacterized protein n=1 Tax=marine sediment metagenome TaxID=412755 RepID=A0A0F9TXI5_9ZZZZ